MAHSTKAIVAVGHKATANVTTTVPSSHTSKAIVSVKHQSGASVTTLSASGHTKKALVSVQHVAASSVTVSRSLRVAAALVNVKHTTSASVIVSSRHTASASVTVKNFSKAIVSVGHKATATVGVSIPVILAPTSLAFVHPTSPPQVVSIVSGLSPFTAVSSNTGVATVVLNANIVTVTPVALGSATITVTDAGGGTKTLAVDVGAVAGVITFNVPSLNLFSGDISPSRTVTVTRLNDTGAFSIQSIPDGFVSISGAGSAPSADYVISPVALGSGIVRVTASDGAQSDLQINTYGLLTASVTSRKNARILTVQALESGYTGPITAAFVGANTATLKTSVTNGPRADFAITDATPGELFILEFTDTLGQTYDLTLKSRNVSLGTVSCTFLDETGVNPVAPGTQYSIYYLGDPQDNQSLVAQGAVGVGGAATVVLDESADYVAVFAGKQAPNIVAQFLTGGAGSTTQSIVVKGYRSPNQSTLGFTASETGLWTRGWVGREFLKPGAPGTTGNAYNLAYSLASTLGLLDKRQQIVSVATRLLSCSGTQVVGTDNSGNSIVVDQVAAFASSYFRDTLPRAAGESDSLYKARIIAALSAQVTTYKGISEAVNAAWDTLGKPGAVLICDVIGYYDQSQDVPFKVWPNPSSNIMTALSLTEPNFVIQLPSTGVTGNAFFTNHSYLKNETYLIPVGLPAIVSSPPALVVKAVESKRALGTIPNYAQISQ